MKRILSASLAIAFCLTLAPPASTQDQNQAIQQKIAAFKQATAENQKALLQYAWTESTELSLKGEVKNTKVEQCQ